MSNKLKINQTNEEFSNVKSNFLNLINSKSFSFKDELNQVPKRQGVYFIHRENGSVLHVGRTYRGQNGLNQRMNNHMRGQSSFMTWYKKITKNSLKKCFFRVIPIKNDRERALLELYTAAILCPKYLGLHKSKKEKLNKS